MNRGRGQGQHINIIKSNNKYTYTPVLNIKTRCPLAPAPKLKGIQIITNNSVVVVVVIIVVVVVYKLRVNNNTRHYGICKHKKMNIEKQIEDLINGNTAIKPPTLPIYKYDNWNYYDTNNNIFEYWDLFIGNMEADNDANDKQ